MDSAGASGGGRRQDLASAQHHPRRLWGLVCPESEGIWLEAARLHPLEVGKSILATAVRRIPHSVKLFLKVPNDSYYERLSEPIRRPPICGMLPFNWKMPTMQEFYCPSRWKRFPMRSKCGWPWLDSKRAIVPIKCSRRLYRPIGPFGLPLPN